MTFRWRQDRPPLPAWPAEAHEHEAAHGFFQRLAAANHQASTRSLAISMGLSDRCVDPQAMLRFCLRFPSKRIDELERATPRVDGALVTLGGERFRRGRDWSLSRPRVCPGCLAEANYHRNWFDLVVLTFCPLHGCELIGGEGRAQLAWWHPHVGVPPATGRSLARSLPRIDPPGTWEHYVLGRIEVLPRWCLPFLAEFELCEIADIAELLGLIGLYGWRRTGGLRRDRCVARRRVAVQRGFEAVCNGRPGIESALRAYVATSEIEPATGDQHYKMFGYYGWLSDAMNHVPESKMRAEMIGCMERVACENGIFSRKGSRIARQAAGMINLYALAERLGLSPQKLREIAVQLGLTPANNPRSQSHWFDPAAIAVINETLADLVPRKEAASLMGMSIARFAEWSEAHQVRPFVRLGRGTYMHDRFRRSDLAKFEAERGGQARRTGGAGFRSEGRRSAPESDVARRSVRSPTLGHPPRVSFKTS